MFSPFELVFFKPFVHIPDVQFSIIKSKISVIENISDCSDKKLIDFAS